MCARTFIFRTCKHVHRILSFQRFDSSENQFLLLRALQAAVNNKRKRRRYYYTYVTKLCYYLTLQDFLSRQSNALARPCRWNLYFPNFRVHFYSLQAGAVYIETSPNYLQVKTMVFLFRDFFYFWYLQESSNSNISRRPAIENMSRCIRLPHFLQEIFFSPEFVQGVDSAIFNFISLLLAVVTTDTLASYYMEHAFYYVSFRSTPAS